METVSSGRPPLLLPRCKKLEFKTASVDGLGSGVGKGRNPHRRTSWKLVGNPDHELVAN